MNFTPFFIAKHTDSLEELLVTVADRRGNAFSKPPDYQEGMASDVYTLPELGIFRHTDGGIYEGLAVVDYKGSSMMLYRHVWPFERSAWLRPMSEWGSRFIQMGPGEMVQRMNIERLEMQEVIKQNKRTRRAREAKQTAGA